MPNYASDPQAEPFKTLRAKLTEVSLKKPLIPKSNEKAVKAWLESVAQLKVSRSFSYGQRSADSL